MIETTGIETYPKVLHQKRAGYIPETKSWQSSLQRNRLRIDCGDVAVNLCRDSLKLANLCEGALPRARPSDVFVLEPLTSHQQTTCASAADESHATTPYPEGQASQARMVEYVFSRK